MLDPAFPLPVRRFAAKDRASATITPSAYEEARNP